MAMRKMNVLAVTAATAVGLVWGAAGTQALATEATGGGRVRRQRRAQCADGRALRTGGGAGGHR